MELKETTVWLINVRLSKAVGGKGSKETMKKFITLLTDEKDIFFYFKQKL